METTFKYKNKIITTPNLEKKLKRMKISIDDIEIIDTPKIEKEEKVTYLYPLDNYHYYKYPDKKIWLLRISKDCPETIQHDNQILTLDKEYTKEQMKRYEGTI